MNEKTLKSELVYDGFLLKVYRDEVELAEGRHSSREYIKHSGASVILAVDEGEKILFVKQFRYSMQKTFIELPAGKKDQKEGPLETANRELIEETGYTADHFVHLADIHPCIGYSNEVIHLVLAENLRFVGVNPDPDESLTLERYTIQEALEKVRSGEITDSKTTLGIFWFHNFLNKKV